MSVIEGLQGHGNTSTPNLVDDPMYDVHAEGGLRQGPNVLLVANCGGEGGGPIDQAPKG